jgi:putative ABC transport system permease protein
MRAVVKAVFAAVRRRRLQTTVLGVVILLSSTTSLLALGLLVASNGPFDQAFTQQNGAHASASFDAAKVSAAELTATTGRPGVTAAAGPYDAVSAQLVSGVIPTPPGLIVARSDATPAVDRLDITDGRWLTGPGQIVLSRDTVGGGRLFRVGSRVTVQVPGRPSLEVVGIADSATATADAWVWPTQSDVLQAEGPAASRQMLYRFSSAGTEAQIETALKTATAGLPDGAFAGASTYLQVKLAADENLAPMVPFVVAFAVLGLVMAVLIVVNVVAGAVVAGFRTIGVQKTIGFTPAQVVSVYAGQILAICVPACLLGVALGRVLATPLLAETAEAYGVSALAAIPTWVDLTVLLAVPVLVALAAVGPAVRAGRLSAVQAITVGRAPRGGRGFRIRRALAATRLPRPVSFGLGTPFARPARAAVTVVAVLLGATTIIFAIGLSTSLSKVETAFNRLSAVQAVVHVPGAGPGGGPGGPQRPRGGGSVDAAAVRAAIQAQPGTARVVGLSETPVHVAGSTEPLALIAYDGDSSWVGFPLLAGRWYQSPDEAVVASRTVRLTGISVGDTVTVSTDLGQRRFRIVGEAFSQTGDATVYTDTAGLAGLVERASPNRFEVGLTEGTDPHAYVEALATAVNNPAVIPQAAVDDTGNETIALMHGLIAMLSTLLIAVAALGVFNTVVLNTRERAHEIGVLKSIGMTPRQVRTMVVTSMVAVGVLGGALAVPIGWALHRWTVPVMGDAAGTALPDSVIAAYHPAGLVALGACGIVLAVLGALVPAGWAARTRVATALRAE